VENDNNNNPLSPIQSEDEKSNDTVDQLTSLTPEPNNTLPATVENQEGQNETQRQTQQFQDRVNQKKTALAERKRTGIDEVDELQARLAVDKDEEAERQRNINKEMEENAEEAKKKSLEEDLLKQYIDHKQKRLDAGQPFQPIEKFEQMIEIKQSEADELKAAADQKIADKLEEDKRKEELKKQQEVEEEKNAIKTQENQVEAARQLKEEKDKQQAEKDKAVQDKMNEEDRSVDFQNFDEYWESRSTGQKILTGISLFLGAFSGNNRSGIDVINDQIEKNIEAKNLKAKLSREEYWKEKEYGLKVAQAQVNKMKANIQNVKAQAELQQLSQKMLTDAQAAKAQRALQTKQFSGEGLSRRDLLQLDQKEAKNYVPIGDGTFHRAFASDSAINKFRDESVDAEAAFKGLTRLQEILDIPGKEFNLTVRAEAATIQTSLKGALRIALFGPGVMTDTEQKLADKIIANPTDVFQLDSSAKAKIGVLLKKVEQGKRDRARSVGIELPKSKNEQRIEQMQEANKNSKKKFSRAEIINALIARGNWDS